MQSGLSRPKESWIFSMRRGFKTGNAGRNRMRFRFPMLFACAVLTFQSAVKADDPNASNDLKQKDNGEKLEPATPGPICDYVPRIEIAPAKACGFNDASVPNPGKYRCGN